MEFSVSDRLKSLPPYLFKELDRLKDEARKKGLDIIDLGVGDPDRPTPPHIIKALQEAADDPANHQYPSYSGLHMFRESVARWYQRRHGVTLDPANQVCTLIGSKEGLAGFPLGVLNQGEVVLMPEPAYPVYKSGCLMAGGVPVAMPLLEKNGFRPDLDNIPEETLKAAKILWLNYPNNPTGATAGKDFYLKAINLAKKWRIILASDAAYSEMTLDGQPHPSILEVPGGLEVAIEFHSLSKTYNMTGWRLGWAAGNESLIRALGLVKSNWDSGAFQAVQVAGVAALEGDQTPVDELRRMYGLRRRALTKGLAQAGLAVFPSPATFYVWAGTPAGVTSSEFYKILLNEAAVACTPGLGFGPSGEGYVRFALTREVARLEEAAARIAKLKF